MAWIAVYQTLDRNSGTKASSDDRRAIQRKDPVRLHTVYPEALQLPFLIEEGKPVAIIQLFQSGDRERVSFQFLHRTHRLPQGLRRIKAGDILRALLP